MKFLLQTLPWEAPFPMNTRIKVPNSSPKKHLRYRFSIWQFLLAYDSNIFKLCKIAHSWTLVKVCLSDSSGVAKTKVWKPPFFWSFLIFTITIKWGNTLLIGQVNWAYFVIIGLLHPHVLRLRHQSFSLADVSTVEFQNRSAKIGSFFQKIIRFRALFRLLSRKKSDNDSGLQSLEYHESIIRFKIDFLTSSLPPFLHHLISMKS